MIFRPFCEEAPPVFDKRVFASRFRLLEQKVEALASGPPCSSSVTKAAVWARRRTISSSMSLRSARRAALGQEAFVGRHRLRHLEDAGSKAIEGGGTGAFAKKADLGGE